jgi:hypothetical protein
MNNDDDALSSVFKKIERERALLNAANQMRQQTQNEQVKARLDTQMREGRRNIQYLEERMQELQTRKMGQGMGDMSLGPSGAGPSGRGARGPGLRNDRDAPPTPPPKDSRGNYIDQPGDRAGYGAEEYSQIGGHGNMMPPRHPYAPPGPGSTMPKSRPNYTKLGTSSFNAVRVSIHDTNHLDRPHQVRYASFRTPHPTDVVTN